MVRTRQSVTPEEKLQAKRERSRRYEHSVKGKATRNEAQRQTYRKSTSRKGPTNPAPLPLLPAALLDLAAHSLPTSDLFQSVLHATDLVDESDLDQWDHVPPYPTPSDHQPSDLYVNNLVDVLHGRRLREHRKNEIQRMERSCSVHLSALRKLISRLLKAEMEVWDRMQMWKEKEGCMEDRNVCCIMSNHFIQWSARKAKALHEELEALRGGKDAYLSLMQSKQTIHSTT